LEIFKLIKLICNNPQSLFILFLLNLIFGFIKMVLYNKLRVNNSLIAFIPVLSYKPLFEMTGVNPIFLLTIFIPYVGSFFYNFALVYVVYKFLRMIGHSKKVQYIGMFLMHLVFFYDALVNDTLLKNYRKSLYYRRQ